MIPMAQIQLEVLTVTPHKVSCPRASVQGERSTHLFLPPFQGGNPLRPIYPDMSLNALICWGHEVSGKGIFEFLRWKKKC